MLKACICEIFGGEQLSFIQQLPERNRDRDLQIDGTEWDFKFVPGMKLKKIRAQGNMYMMFREIFCIDGKK